MSILFRWIMLCIPLVGRMLQDTVENQQKPTQGVEKRRAGSACFSAAQVRWRERKIKEFMWFGSRPGQSLVNLLRIQNERVQIKFFFTNSLLVLGL